MEQGETTLDLVFGIGFKIGFLVIIVGLLMFYMPLIDHTVMKAMDYTGLWDAFRTLPVAIKVILAGTALASVAVIMASLKVLVEDLVDGLLG